MTAIAWPVELITARLSGRARLAITTLTAAAAVAFLIFGHADVHMVYDDLATSFLAGRLDVPVEASPEYIPLVDGRAYSPFPPMPAIPFMALQAVGLSIPSTVMLAVIGAIGVVLAYRLARGLGAAEWPAVALSAGLAGSTFGWAAATGGTWMHAQVLAATLAFGGLAVASRSRTPMAAGLLLGLAAGSRLPVGLTLPLFVYFYRRSPRALALLGGGVAAVAIPLAAYNLARFGSPFDFGYEHLVSWNGVPTILGESWYADGVLSLSYIPRSLGHMLFDGFHVSQEAPWLHPDWTGLSVALAAPTFLLALGARGRLAAFAIATAVLVMLPNWAHGSWGFYQFGYRFLIDAMPALFVALALAYPRGPTRVLIGSVVIGLLVNAYGLLADGAGWFVGPTY